MSTHFLFFVSVILVCLFSTIIASNVSLALLQIPTGLSTNLIETYIQKAADSKADIAVFPSQYFNASQCIDNGEMVNHAINWATHYEIAIVISCNNTKNQALINNAVLIDQNGNILLNYTQISGASHLNSNLNLSVATLQTSYSNIEIIASILLDEDIYYPELARSLMLQNVQLILFPTNGILSESDDIVLYTRSYENVAIIARANDHSKSAVAAQFGFAENINEMFILPPNDTHSESVNISSFNLSDLINTRQHSIFGDAFRRPFRYQQLCGLQQVNTLFIQPGNDDIIVTVAALQMVSGQSVSENLQIADDFVHKAAAMGADIVFMPEMWSIGYVQLYPGYEHGNITSLNNLYGWLKLSSSKQSMFYNHFKSLAKNLSIAIGMAYMENIGLYDPPKNSITLFDRNGSELYTYSKVHTVNVGQDEALTTPGDEFFVAELDLGDGRGKIMVGSMICYDQEFPESARILSQLGVELILKPNACMFDMGAHWRLRSKAIENSMGIMMANYAYPSLCYPGGGFCNGNSCGYDWNGDIFVEANVTAQVVISKFNVNEIRKARLVNKERINSYKLMRLCDFERLSAFTQPDGYSRVSGSTI